MSKTLKQTSKSMLKRIPDRASYDREAAYAILDEGLICHVGFANEDGVFVIPMAYARVDDDLLLHGSVASRLTRALSAGVGVCVCVTHLDGLVLARSIFEHSMNYRSIVAFGNVRAILNRTAKLEALKALTEHLVPGRWNDARQPNRRELAATAVLLMALDEASIKTRSGPPADLVKDMGLRTWAGVIPIFVGSGSPRPDPLLASDIAPPLYVSQYSRRQQKTQG